MGRKRSTAAVLAVALAAAAGACGENEPEPASVQREPPSSTQPDREPPESPPVARVECPGDVPDCVSARGEIVYVERVDPDGDGDAHFVLLSEESVTGPGITVVDVRADLRPSPLPGPGDWVAAAGPVYPGSYGQRQIEAVTVDFAAGG